MSTFRSYRQVNNTVNFQTGSLNLTLWDGNWLFGCTGPTFFPPNNLVPCPLGATGFLTSSAVIIPNPYQEIFSVIPAVLIEPGQPQAVQLYAAPPSKLPRPLANFADASFFIWYDLRTNGIQQYPITRYAFSRPYASRSSMDSEVVTGLYQWLAPRLVPERQTGNLIPPVGINVTYAPIPEGSLKQNNVTQGMRFTNTQWSEDGYVELDPRLPGRISWEGNNPDRVYPSTDQLFFSVLVPEDPADPLSPIADDPNPDNGGGEWVAFPFFNVSSRSILLPTALDKYFTLPPGFLPPPYEGLGAIERPFSFGRTLIARLTLQRNLYSNAIARDTSRRDFELPIRFTNTYAGFVQQFFGGNATPVSVRGEDADPDGDGFTNFQEWQQGTNPNIANLAPDTVPPANFPAFEDFQRQYWVPDFVFDIDLGISLPEFPPTSAPGADPDGDGLTNEEEWLAGTNPIVPNPVDPDPDGLLFVAADGARSAGNTEGYWFMAYPKVAFHSSSIKYDVEHSKDMKTWAPIKNDDLVWTVVNDISADNIVIRSRSANIGEGGFFRLKTTRN